MKRDTAPVSRPTKGVKPNFAGVKGEIVKLDGLDLVFGKRRLSPYDTLLTKLSESPKGSGIRYESVRAMASVKVRAKKLGLRVSFAEHSDGSLYVRYDGRLDDDVKLPRRNAILAALRTGGPASYIKLANGLRDRGDTDLNAGDVEVIVLQMQKDGLVIRQEGNNWAINPKPPSNDRAAAATR